MSIEDDLRDHQAREDARVVFPIDHYPTDEEWMEMIKFQLAQTFDQMKRQLDELTAAYLASKRKR